MKHFTKLFVGILFLILGGTQSGFAQDIDDMLLEKAVNPADVAGQKDADGNPVYVYCIMLPTRNSCMVVENSERRLY